MPQSRLKVRRPHIMRSLRFIWLSFLLAFFANSASAQIIYGVGSHRGPITVVRQDEHFWVIESETGWYGLFQFIDGNGEKAPWIRRTSIYFGKHQFTVPI